MLSLLSFTLKLKKSFLFFVLNCEEILQTFTLTTYVKVIGGVQKLLFNPLFCFCSFDENSPEASFFFSIQTLSVVILCEGLQGCYLLRSTIIAFNPTVFFPPPESLS